MLAVTSEIDQMANDRPAATAAIKRILDEKAEMKVDKYAPTATGSFHPLVMSVGGGTLSTTTEDVFRFWKKILGSASFDSLLRSISISLLRAKSRFFVL